MTHNAKGIFNDVMSTLIGGKIIDVTLDDSEDFAAMIIEKGKKVYAVWIQSDEEGNDSGALNIQDITKEVR